MVSEKKTMLHTMAAMIFMACLLMPGMCSAQSDAWTWMSGSDQVDEPGVYGTRGVADPANMPGARYDSCSWTDSSGDLWLFGGIEQFGGSDETAEDLLNDLWYYNSGTGEWTWMSGDDVTNQPGIYGTKYVADAANTPGARHGAVCWIDENDDLWLFGGYGYSDSFYIDMLNDMWRYDMSLNQWVWEKGKVSTDNMLYFPPTLSYERYEKGWHSDPGYPQDYERPGGRYGAIAWTDSYGFMWMFGGYGYQDLWEYYDYRESDGTYCFERDSTCPDPGVLNDLWVYNKATNEWAWVSGAKDKDQLGDYGIKGEPSFANMPGARRGSIPWIDEDNNLWLFGGVGKDVDVPEDYWRRMSDLWRYDPVAKMWTWINGPDVGDQIGIYNTGLGDLLPGCREESSSWVDNDGNLWLVGGVRSGKHVFTHWRPSE